MLCLLELEQELVELFLYGGNLLKPKKNEGFEIGHMVIEKDGIQCSCGKRGCFERYASIKSLKRKVTDILGERSDISGQYLRENLLII